MPHEWSWKEKVDRFCLGYDNARAEGERLGINVMFGWEAGVGWTHLLTYGLDKQWLYENPDVVGLGLKEYADKIHSAGGFIVHAHSFREGVKTPVMLPDDVDAIEIINGSQPDISNFRANAYADMLSLPKTAGSDIHNVKTDRRRAGVISKTPLHTPLDYISSLKDGKLNTFQVQNEYDKVKF